MRLPLTRHISSLLSLSKFQLNSMRFQCVCKIFLRAFEGVVCRSLLLVNPPPRPLMTTLTLTRNHWCSIQSVEHERTRLVLWTALSYLALWDSQCPSCNTFSLSTDETVISRQNQWLVLDKTICNHFLHPIEHDQKCTNVLAGLQILHDPWGLTVSYRSQWQLHHISHLFIVLQSLDQFTEDVYMWSSGAKVKRSSIISKLSFSPFLLIVSLTNQAFSHLISNQQTLENRS